MAAKHYIYKITSPTKKVYVGSTNNISRRWRSYKNLKCKEQKKLYNSLLKYGVEKHKFEIITECEEVDLLKLETQFGELYNVLDYKSGLNLQLPKDGDKLGGVSKEVINPGRFKKGIIPKNKGIPRTEEQKLHHSLIMMGRKSKKKGIKTNKPAWNKGLKTNKPAWNKGVSCKESTKELISKTKKGKPSKKKGKKYDVIPHNAKLVLCLNTGIFYYSSTEASNIYSIRRTTLNNMLDGKSKNKTSLIYV